MHLKHLAAWLLWSATRFVVILSARFSQSAFSSRESTTDLEQKVKAFYQPTIAIPAQMA
jgi:hypothetical protein